MKSGRQRGTSLLELMVVLAIAAVVTSFSVALFGRSKDSFGRQNAARQFKNLLERARFDSVKRRASTPSQFAKVTVNSVTSYSYSIDSNQNGVIDTGETVTVDLSSLGDVRFGSSSQFPITITFDQRGITTTVDATSAPVTPLFYICSGPCSSSTSTDQNSNIIYVSPSGTVAMMKGGSMLPSFNNPSVTTVAASTSVNPALAVWDADPNAPLGSSAPTPTPTPAPTPSPTPDGTTPTPTPTPSATPAACLSGQNASASACTCIAPMWIRSNGKCR